MSILSTSKLINPKYGHVYWLAHSLQPNVQILCCVMKGPSQCIFSDEFFDLVKLNFLKVIVSIHAFMTILLPLPKGTLFLAHFSLFCSF